VEGPPLPDGVLVQSIYEDAEGEQAGWRVWRDGRHEGRRADDEGWTAGPTIDAAGVDELRAILDDADLDAMAGVHRPEGETEHESTLWFQVARSDGTTATVALTGGASLPALDALIARLTPILSGGAAP
jgi:hypothetical protein